MMHTTHNDTHSQACMQTVVCVANYLVRSTGETEMQSVQMTMMKCMRQVKKRVKGRVRRQPDAGKLGSACAKKPRYWS